MVLEEMTCHYWAASMAMHGVPLPHPMTRASARLTLAGLARCRHGRLRCAAGGALVSITGAGPEPFEPMGPPFDVEPA